MCGKPALFNHAKAIETRKWGNINFGKNYWKKYWEKTNIDPINREKLFSAIYHDSLTLILEAKFGDDSRTAAFHSS